MRAVFVTELFLWPRYVHLSFILHMANKTMCSLQTKILIPKICRFHGSIIKSLKNRQADVVELHIPLTSNVSHIQTCLIDIMNYTVKQLKSINRTLDLQVKLLLTYFSFKCESLWVWMFRCPFLFHANITERS